MCESACFQGQLAGPGKGAPRTQALLLQRHCKSEGRCTTLLRTQVSFVLSCLALAFVAAAYVFTRSRPVYLLNFHTFKPPAQ